MDAFANDTPANRDEAFRQAAAELGFAKAIIEKDFWVCWSLQHLFALPSFGDHLIFKGGTSLSKAYDVIHRFSEDVDLSLDRTQLGFAGDRDPENPELSSGKRKSLLQDLQEAAEATVAGPLLEEINIAFSASLEQPFSLQIDGGEHDRGDGGGDQRSLTSKSPAIGSQEPGDWEPTKRRPPSLQIVMSYRMQFYNSNLGQL